MKENKFEIEIWSVTEVWDIHENSIKINYRIKKPERYISDNLSELFDFLSRLNIHYDTVNSFLPGTHSKIISSKYIYLGRTLYYANIYHRGQLLKIYKTSKNGKLDFSACGFKFKNGNKNKCNKHIIKYNFRNINHKNIYTKSYAHAQCTISEISLSECNVPYSFINKMNRKNNFIKDDWYFYEKYRNKPVKSWKSYKKKRQWA